MHLKKLAAIVAAIFVAMAALPQTATAHRSHQSAHGHDPYAYRYEPRGYYPYYKSHYWRPAHLVRRRRGIKAPKYYPAWGYYKKHYNHRRWHKRHHGGHRFWQW